MVEIPLYYISGVITCVDCPVMASRNVHMVSAIVAVLPPFADITFLCTRPEDDCSGNWVSYNNKYSFIDVL
jgi:hypothetical protein